MPRKGHSEEQIIWALRQAEGELKVSDVCREMGVSQQAFYRLETEVRRSRAERVARVGLGSRLVLRFEERPRSCLRRCQVSKLSVPPRREASWRPRPTPRRNVHSQRRGGRNGIPRLR